MPRKCTINDSEKIISSSIYLDIIDKFKKADQNYIDVINQIDSDLREKIDEFMEKNTTWAKKNDGSIDEAVVEKWIAEKTHEVKQQNNIPDMLPSENATLMLHRNVYSYDEKTEKKIKEGKALYVEKTPFQYNVIIKKGKKNEFQVRNIPLDGRSRKKNGQIVQYAVHDLEAAAKLSRKRFSKYYDLDSAEPELYADPSDKKEKNARKKGKKKPRVLKSVIEAQNLAEELHSTSDIKESESHKDYLINDLIPNILQKDGKYFPNELDVFVANSDGQPSGHFNAYKKGKKNAGIYVSKGSAIRTASNEQGPLEKFTHELLHGSSYYSLVSKNPLLAGTRKRLYKLHEHVLKNLTYDKLLSGTIQNSSDKEIKIAKARLEYLKSKDGIHEFVALGLSNEILVEELKNIPVYRDKTIKAKNAFEMLKFIAQDMIDLFFQIVRKENKDSTAYDVLYALHSEIMKINNEAEIQIEENKFSFGIMNKLNSANTYLSNKVKEFEKKGEKTPFPDPPAENAGSLEKMTWLLKSLLKLGSDHRTRHIYQDVLASLGSWVGYDSFLQQIIRSFSTLDDMEEAIENLGIISQNIDGNMHTTKVTVAQTVKKIFDEKLSRKELSTLTEVVLENDLQVFGSEYDIEKLMTDSNFVENEISNIENKIKEISSSKKKSTFYINSSRNLGSFMVNHIGGSTSLLNAENIARELGTKNVIEPSEKVDPGLVDLIDKLASLEALRLSDQSEKNKISEIEKQHPGSIYSIMGIHKSFVEESKKELFSGSSLNMIKGYTKEIFSQDMDIEIAPMSKRRELEAKGYIFESKVPKSIMTNIVGEMGFFINPDGGLEEFTKQAIRTTTGGRRGTSIGDILFAKESNARASDIKRRERIINQKITAVNQKNIDKMYDGPNTNSPKNGMVPVFNANGSIQTYRFIMSKEKKENILKQDKRASLVLGHMFANTINHVESREQNIQVSDIIIEDLKENYISGTDTGRNGRKYVMIGDNEDIDPKMKEKWLMIPKDIRLKLEEDMREANKKILGSKVFKGVPVRADLVGMYFGERELSLANLGIIESSPAQIKHAIKVAESMWQELVKIYKTITVIKTPAVWFGNFTSIYVILQSFGIGPLESLKGLWKGFTEVNPYRAVSKDIHELSIEISKDKFLGKDVSDKILELERLKEELKKNSAHDLIIRGGFPTIVDEIKSDDVVAQNKIVRYFDNKIEDAPEYARNGANWFFMSEKTSLYQTMLKFIQYADFAGRYAIYHHKLQELQRDFVEKNGRQPNNTELEKLKDISANIAKHIIINYGSKASQTFQYVNKMGPFFFVRFFLGAQRAIAINLKDKPASFLFALGFQSAALDLESMDEHSVFTKNYSGLYHSPFEVVDTALSTNILDLPELLSKSLSSVG